MNAICLPDGMRMALTYRRKWIEDETWARCVDLAKPKRNPAWLTLRRARSQALRLLVVLFEADGQPNRRYLPLRFASVEAVEVHEHLSSSFASPDKVEPGVTLFVVLGERPSERLVGELADVLGHCGVVNYGQNLSKYLSQVPTPEQSLAPYTALLSSQTNWERHLGMIIERSVSLEGERHWAVFGSFKPVRGRRAKKPITPLRKSTPHATTFALRGGASYEIDCHVHENSVGTWSETPISASVVGSHLEVSPASVSQFGGGALVHFLVATQRKFSPEIVGMNFAVLAKASDGKMTPVPRGKAPEFHCRFEIGPPPLFWAQTFLMLFTSAVLLNFSSGTIGEIVQSWTGQPVADPAPLLYATIALWAKGLGGVFVALTSIYALRKMPVGK
jgi:hypothetical protein